MQELNNILANGTDEDLTTFLSIRENRDSLNTVDWTDLIKQRPKHIIQPEIIKTLNSSILTHMVIMNTDMMSSGIVNPLLLSMEQIDQILVRHPKLIDSMPESIVIRLPSTTMLSILLGSEKWHYGFRNLRLRSDGILAVAEAKPEYLQYISIAHLSAESVMRVVTRYPALINHTFPKSLMTPANTAIILEAHPDLKDEISTKWQINKDTITLLQGPLDSSARNIISMILEDKANLEDDRVIRCMNSIMVRELLMMKPSLVNLTPNELLTGEDLLAVLMKRPKLVSLLDLRKLDAIGIITLLKSKPSALRHMDDTTIVSRILCELIQASPGRFSKYRDTLLELDEMSELAGLHEPVQTKLDI